MSDPEIQPLAPPWLPRQQRRQLDRILNKLVDREACSICGSDWKHNSRTAYGLDRNDKIVVAGECCIDQVVVAFGHGFFSERKYDFLNPPSGASYGASRGTPQDASEAGSGASPAPSPARKPETWEEIDEAIALRQRAIAAADEQFEGIEKHGDVELTGKALSMLDYPWKTDDRVWFGKNPRRSHRVRMPFPGEFDELGAKAPAGHALVILVRQVKPGTRARHSFYLNADLLPVPDDEAIAHTLFEVATEREPLPRNGWALNALIAKYANRGSC